MAPAKGHLPVTPVHTEILIDSSVNNLPEIKSAYYIWLSNLINDIQ